MLTWLLLTLLAVVSAQDQICASSTSETDLSARLFADVTTVTRDAILRPLAIEYSGTVVVNKDLYDAAISARFSFRGEWTTEQNAAIKEAIKLRMDAIVAAFPPATDASARIALFVCVNAKASIFVAALESLQKAVADFLIAYFNAFTDYQAAVNEFFKNFIVVVSGNDAVAIATVRVQVAAARALQTTKDVQFYVAEKQQDATAAVSDAIVAVTAWLNAINTGATVAVIADARAAAEAKLLIVVQYQIDLRRAKEIETQVKAEIEAIRAELEAAKIRLANAVAIAWTEARAQLIAHFEFTVAKVEENKRRLADALAAIRCDTVNATFTATLQGDQATGAVKVEFRGIRCYDTRSDLSAFFCAAIRAWVLTEGAAVRADSYTCVAVAKKRSLEQTGTDMSADLVAAEQTSPVAPPTPISASSSVVACFILLALCVLFHF